MTDIVHEFEDVFGDIYVERKTTLLYEVKFFSDFVLVRPASPSFYQALRKMDYGSFADEFEEYNGDHEAVKECIRGMQPDLIVEG